MVKGGVCDEWGACMVKWGGGCIAKGHPTGMHSCFNFEFKID